jgi:hypothetical protein
MEIEGGKQDIRAVHHRGSMVRVRRKENKFASTNVIQSEMFWQTLEIRVGNHS